MSGSARLFERAKKVLVGGVNSPVRAFGAVGGTPVFISHGKGSHIFDVDGNEYIDYVMSWGPLILGHAHEEILKAVREYASKGTSFGAPCEVEVEMAELVTSAIPSVEMVRFVNSGTEATMSAIRLARGVTGRKRIVKFDGCYHGHTDSLLVKAGSGALTFGLPGSPGIPDELSALTTVLPYNDANALDDYMKKHGEETACVIVELIAGNMGVITPEHDFLEALKNVRSHGALLVADEVITGFRVAFEGAQTVLGIEPDITCLGKIIGGGFPVGAYGGPKDIMTKLAPLGDVYQAGTLSGNPVAMAAGLATLRILKKERPYDRLDKIGKTLENGLLEAAKETDVSITINRVGSVLTVFFNTQKVKNLEAAKSSNINLFSQFFHSMLKRGIYLPPSQFEGWFISTAHTEDDIRKTIEAARASFKELKV